MTMDKPSPRAAGMPAAAAAPPADVSRVARSVLALAGTLAVTACALHGEATKPRPAG
jgi:hypothetical protein